MKVIMTGGGTGGHIYPAVAIADKIKRKNPEAEILFLGTQKGMEKDLVPKAGYPIRFITVSGFHRKQIWKNMQTAKDLMKGMKESREILREFQPDFVIGTGGYVCGPVVKSAHKMGIPCYIHEQNAFPGVTNKMLEKYVDKVFVSFPEAGQYFKHPEKMIVTGNPIRKSFFTNAAFSCREKLGIGEKEFTVLCFGGSLGAEKINEAMLTSLKTLDETKDLRVFFVTGKRYFEEIKKKAEVLGIEGDSKITLLPYIDNMNVYLSACDLVIGRAGALTVSEITACGKVSVLIPSPNVTGNHQYFNAKVVADKGGAILIEEKELSSDKLISSILRLKNNPEILNKMSLASEAVGRVDAVDVIYDHLKI